MLASEAISSAEVIVLGVGIAKLNIFITKKLQEKKKAKEEMDENIAKNPVIDTSYIAQRGLDGIFKDFN